MQSFLARHQAHIQGTISGFDRLRFAGQMLLLSFADGLARFLSANGLLLKHFGEYVDGLSDQVKRASIKIAEATPTGHVHYLASSEQRKEDYVLQLPGRGIRPASSPCSAASNPAVPTNCDAIAKPST